jgi:hypothetical protein
MSAVSAARAARAARVFSSGYAVRSGMGRAMRAWTFVVGAWLMTLVVSLPTTLGVRERIAAHLGQSLEASVLAEGADNDWMNEFESQASGAASTFGSSVIGFAAVADSVETVLEGSRQPSVILATGVVYVLLWTFLAGGIIDRCARDRALRTHGFFQVCGGHFPALFRLGLLSGFVYLGIARSFYPWLLDLYDQITRNVDVERTAFGLRLGVLGVFLLALGGANLIFDFAKIRLVVEDRRSALGAVHAAVRFIARNPVGSVVVYIGSAIVFALVVALSALLLPGPGRVGPSMWLSVTVAQAFVIARIWTKLVFWASEAEWFQSRLAHAGYVSKPLPEWPDSVLAEGLGGG